MGKERIDKLLVELALAPSRERAQALIMAGAVLVNENPVTKAGTSVKKDAAIRIKGKDNPFVSRGGLKLDGALGELNIEMEGMTVLDVGASTGGFTDCCLKRGAKMVYAVDVGTNQLIYALRQNPKVLCLEQTNARHMTPEIFPRLADIAVMDVSFISITKVLAATVNCLKPNGQVVAMVKPQFEVGKDKVGKGGVVRDDGDRALAVKTVTDFAVSIGLSAIGQVDSSIPGPKGNREIFVHLTKEPPPC